MMVGRSEAANTCDAPLRARACACVSLAGCGATGGGPAARARGGSVTQARAPGTTRGQASQRPGLHGCRGAGRARAEALRAPLEAAHAAGAAGPSARAQPCRCQPETQAGSAAAGGAGARLERNARSSAGLVPSASFLRSLSAPVAASTRKLSSWPSPSATSR